MASTKNRDILLVGSIRLARAEDVLRTVASLLGEKVRRLPDGETDIARSVWSQCQTPFFWAIRSSIMYNDPCFRAGSTARVPHRGRMTGRAFV